MTLLNKYLLYFLFIASSANADELLRVLENSPQSALLISEASGTSVYSLNPDTPLIPASTLKILTALMAIEQWGLEHRFTTEFYLQTDKTLVIKGFGDPYLISEELDLIVAGIKATGEHAFSSITLDTSAFSNAIEVEGQSDSSNPYDAPAGAIAANFNTVYLQKMGKRITSREKQTPLTAIASKIGESLPNGKHRVNIKDSHTGSIYFAELLRAKLAKQSITSGHKIKFDLVTDNAKLIYRHHNSHTLEDTIKAMLKYSTNFIANQLFLQLGVETGTAPASMDQSRTMVKHYIAQHFSWKNTVIQEGAGLSRSNQICASQLVALLQRFRPYAYLLPAQKNGMIGKTGTLKNISSYAGFFSADNTSPVFALLINDKKIATSRNKILGGIKRRWISEK